MRYKCNLQPQSKVSPMPFLLFALAAAPAFAAGTPAFDPRSHKHEIAS